MIVSIYVEGFTKDEIADYELLRLSRVNTQKYYQNYLNGVFYSDIKSKIAYFLKYFKIYEDDNSLFYIGDSFGEEKYNSENYNGTRDVYIDLKKHKDTKERINLAVIKSKLEDDFLSYKFAKIVKSLYDLELINEDLYNSYLYNTTNKETINLMKVGFSFQLINFIKDKKLESEIKISNTGVTVSEKFLEVLSAEDDFIQFEIKKFL